MSGRSRNKGKVGERQFRDVLRAAGFAAERGCQHRGGPTSPDVVCEALGRFHFEVKRQERLRLLAAMDQAITDAGERMPVVAWRPNRSGWVCMIRAEDLLKVIAHSDLVTSPST